MPDRDAVDALRAPRDGHSPYRICDLQGRGKGIVVTQDVGINAEILDEPALLTVRTFMILGGVIVLRRSRVEQAYESLSESEKKQYRALCPVCEPEHLSVQGKVAAIGNCEPSVRHRAGTAGDTIVSDPTGFPSGHQLLTTVQHREIWDCNGFHYCDDADVRFNRWLHLCVFPALLSVILGCIYAWRFKGHYIRSVFGVAILFFTVMGPISVRLFYLGSQAIFLQASRANHSCLPNAVSQINANRGPLGTLGDTSQQNNLDVPAPTGSNPTAIKLSLRATTALPSGEEVTIDYIPDLAHLDRAERRNLLQQEFGFQCCCLKCSDSKGQRTASVHVEEEESF